MTDEEIEALQSLNDQELEDYAAELDQIVDETEALEGALDGAPVEVCCSCA